MPVTTAGDWNQKPSDGTLPIALVHGYDFSFDAANDGTQWDPLIREFQGWSWTGSFAKWAYYGLDTGAGGIHDASRYGKTNQDPHIGDSLFGGATSHEGTSAGGPGKHDRYTSIAHLAFHLAWGINQAYDASGGCANVVAHSMGGLITRYALAQVQLQNPDFPPTLCIPKVVTLGTPHQGAMWPGSAQECFTVQCAEMQTDSNFISWVSTNAKNPQGAGGTRWIAIGSEDDQVVSAASATSLQAWQLVNYRDGNQVYHSNPPSYMTSAYTSTTSGYPSYAATDATASVRFHAEGRTKDACNGHWPVYWAFKALRSDDSSWLPNGACAPVQSNAPSGGSPTLSRVSPTASAVTTATGSSITFQARADDGDADLDRTDFKVNGVVQGTDTCFTSCHYDDASWTTTFTTAGTATVVAIAYDDAGHASPEVQWTITVQQAQNSGPSLEWATPAAGSHSRSTSQTFDVEVECNDDPQGDSVSVDFYSASTVIGTVQDTFGSSPDFSYSFSQAGTFTLKARCRDGTGAYASPNDHTWTVTVTSPGGGGTTLASNRPLAIPASSALRHQFSLSQTATATYSFGVTDSSTIDIGFIRDSDWPAYSSGTSVQAYGYRTNVQSTSQSVSLAPGTWDLVFYCRNTTFDCDITYNLSYA